MAPDEAARLVLDRLRAQGPAGLDAVGGLDPADPSQRERAASTSLELAFDLLPPGGRERFAELGVFAEDEHVLVALVAHYWGVTCGIGEAEAWLLCYDLADLSLIGLSDKRAAAIRLHDVYRDLLHAELGGRLPQLHAHLIQAAAQALAGGRAVPRQRLHGPSLVGV
jgi:hypothetical protein